MLKQRILTAIVLIPITIAILFYLPPPAFLYLTAFIALGGAWEWSKLMGLTRTSSRWLYFLLMLSIFSMVIFAPVVVVLFIAFIWWLFAALLVELYPRASLWWGKSIAIRGLMGIFVLVPCWIALNFIRNQQDGIYTVFFLFILIWGADSAAYFVGRKWGKHKLIPQVSPGKSVEGLLGAVSFSLLITVLVVWLVKVPKQLWIECMLLSLLTVLFSVVGDLFESMLKRQTGVKDSGNLLPGHGGLLDRIDSLTAAAPTFAVFAWVMGQIQ